jgi:hypothetical protein
MRSDEAVTADHKDSLAKVIGSLTVLPLLSLHPIPPFEIILIGPLLLSKGPSDS